MSSDGGRLARTLGMFGVGLGLTQLLAPRAVSRAIGLKNDGRNRKTILAFGVREIATGISLLTRAGPASFVWGRVAGDAMNLAVLRKALISKRSGRSRVAAVAVVGVTILDIVAGIKLSRSANGSASKQWRERGIRVRKAITVSNSPEEAYNFWRNFENLPRFMTHIESVRAMDQRRSYWKAKAPLGATVEWVAEIIEDRPNQLIVWRALEGADISNAGQVRFLPVPGQGGTEVHVELTHVPPGGLIGATIAKLFGEEPSRQVEGDLRRFREVLQSR